MATNNFLPFAGSGGANVLTQAAYAALGVRTTGFASGTAKSAELNKVWRQASLMSSALAQAASDLSGDDMLDDGTTAALVASIKKAFGGGVINVRVFSATTVYTKTPGTNSVIVKLQGPGGGGGGAPATAAGQCSLGNGGGAGAYAEGRFTSGFDGVTITLPSGGIGGTGAAGALGGTASFGGLMTCPGGKGGNTSGPSNVAFFAATGNSDAPTGGNIEQAQGAAADLSIVLNVTTAQVAKAGASKFGPGAGPSGTFGSPGANAVSKGSGGGGTGNLASSAAVKGGDGGGAYCVVVELA